MSENELRDALAALASPAQPPPGASTRIHAGVRRAARRRRLVVGAGVLVTGLALTGGVLWLERPDHDSMKEDRTPTAPTVTAPWEPIAPSPLSARQGQATVWTGEEMLVIGGNSAPPCPATASCMYDNEKEALTDGAAYNPETDAWRPIAEMPRAASSLSAIWDGQQVVVSMLPTYPMTDPPRDRPAALYLTYDIATDRWTDMGRVPRMYLTGEVTPLGLLFWSDENTESGGAFKDTETGAWTEVPPLPWRKTFDRSFTWGDDRLYVTAQLTDDQTINTYVFAAYEPTRGTWEELPRTPVNFWDPTWSWFQGHLVNATQGMRPEREVGTASASGVWDSETGRWTHAPQLNNDDELLASCRVPDLGPAGSWLLHDQTLVSLEPRRVISVPPCPPYGEIGGAAWTGEQLIIWGATTNGLPDYRNVAVGMSWTPPAP